MENITIFQNNEFGKVRTIEKEGNGYFNLNDVCEILGISNVGNVKVRLSEAGIRTMDVRCESENGVVQNRSMTFINESNLYKCIFQSRKANAERFTEWVTSEVLPSIRKHGAYMTEQTIESVIADPDNMIKLLTSLKEERNKRKELEYKMEENKPKVLFAECVEGSKSSILVGDLAKLITQNGYEIGQNRLFSWLRENGYLIKNGERRNLPTQTSIEMGLFEIKESTHINPNGSIRITRTPKVKGKGQIYFIKKFLSNKEER